MPKGWDSTDLALRGLDVLDSLSGRCGRIVLVIMSGRPVIVTDALGKVDTAVAAWLPRNSRRGDRRRPVRRRELHRHDADGLAC